MLRQKRRAFLAHGFRVYRDARLGHPPFQAQHIAVERLLNFRALLLQAVLIFFQEQRVEQRDRERVGDSPVLQRRHLRCDDGRGQPRRDGQDELRSKDKFCAGVNPTHRRQPKNLSLRVLLGRDVVGRGLVHFLFFFMPESSR